jgi:hypothetical protein
MLVAVDPGLHNCGVSVWSADGRLLEARLVKNTVEMPGPLNAGPMARAVAAEVPLCDCDLVIEVPQVYPYGQGKGNPNDLIDLAAVAGACMGLAGGLVTYYLPRQWKGQVPKEISHARAMAQLADIEKANIVLCKPAGLMHNVYDAVALGLAHLQKTGKRKTK